MGKNSEKIWANYRKTSDLFGYYLTAFFVVPILSILFSMMPYAAQLKELNAWEAIKISFRLSYLDGLKWWGIIMVIITILAVLLFLFGRASSTVEFTEDSILYYENIFSKNPKSILYSSITECVVVCDLWKSNKEKTRARKVMLFDGSFLLLPRIGVYNQLVLRLVNNLGEPKVKVVTRNGNLKTFSKYYKIDFMSLNDEDKLKIIDYYCNIKGYDYKPGNEILQKKK